MRIQTIQLRSLKKKKKVSAEENCNRTLQTELNNFKHTLENT